MDKSTRLKCKPCNEFYKDDGSVQMCLKCGKKLKRINVYTLQPSDLTVVTGAKLEGQSK